VIVVFELSWSVTGDACGNSAFMMTHHGLSNMVMDDDTGSTVVTSDRKCHAAALILITLAANGRTTAGLSRVGLQRPRLEDKCRYATTGPWVPPGIPTPERLPQRAAHDSRSAACLRLGKQWSCFPVPYEEARKHRHMTDYAWHDMHMIQ